MPFENIRSSFYVQLESLIKSGLQNFISLSDHMCDEYDIEFLFNYRDQVGGCFAGRVGGSSVPRVHHQNSEH